MHSCLLPCLQHDHPYISSMVNDGTLHYDHDSDGTHGQMDGCTVSEVANDKLCGLCG